jgi:hypothetical protein
MIKISQHQCLPLKASCFCPVAAPRVTCAIRPGGERRTSVLISRLLWSGPENVVEYQSIDQEPAVDMPLFKVLNHNKKFSFSKCSLNLHEGIN